MKGGNDGKHQPHRHPLAPFGPPGLAYSYPSPSPGQRGEMGMDGNMVMEKGWPQRGDSSDGDGFGVGVYVSLVCVMCCMRVGVCPDSIERLWKVPKRIRTKYR